MVLTDGYFSKSTTFYQDPALQRAVAALNANNVIVFFFSIGPGEADNPADPLTSLRNLSCVMNSSVTYVSQLDAQWNPLWAIRPYFDYQAQLRFVPNKTFWTDTYTDFDGLGEVSTVTYPGIPLSAFNPKVQQVDVLISELWSVKQRKRYFFEHDYGFHVRLQFSRTVSCMELRVLMCLSTHPMRISSMTEQLIQMYLLRH